jgi:L-aminopeptidase/D-esterase-like protein
VRIGTAEYAEGPTGATVLAFERALPTAVDRRGGAIGATGCYPENHAICLAGGSVYGLAAAAGVAEALLEEDGAKTAFDQLKLVSGAIIYDFSVRRNAVFPDAALGAAALAAAREGRASFGRVGGGIGASVGKVDPVRGEFAGQGVAFEQVGPVKVLVVSVVNAVGVVVGRDGRVVRGNCDRATGRRCLPVEDWRDGIGRLEPVRVSGGNTTVTAVVTNIALAPPDLAQFAAQVHSSMHRAIQPFHTALDGDILFAVTTEDVTWSACLGSGFEDQAAVSVALGALAGEVAWDAVLAAVD